MKTGIVKGAEGTEIMTDKKIQEIINKWYLLVMEDEDAHTEDIYNASIELAPLPKAHLDRKDTIIVERDKRIKELEKILVRYRTGPLR